MRTRNTRNLFFIIFLSLLIGFLYFVFLRNQYIVFSDAAKYADIARNIVNGIGYKTNFVFFAPEVQKNDLPVFAHWILPVYPLSIAAGFLIGKVSGMTVIFSSFVFYVLIALVVYALGEKIWGNITGFIAALTVITNPNFIDYATGGASETLFAFEIVLAAYLFILRKKWADISGFLILVLMYFTRPQAFIFIAGFILLWLLLRFKPKKALFNFLLIILLGILIDRLILVPLSGKFFLYSITSRGSYAATQHLPGVAVSESLRGVVQDANLLTVFKKVFYNLYNFYKLLPQIASPYMWALFVIGLFKWGKDKTENSLKIATIFMVVAIFLVTALTIPFFRYLHPVIPLVYLFATATLVWIVGKMVKKRLVAIVSTLLIIFFVVGQTLGVIFLDSRYKAARTNKDEPPVYVKLSRILNKNTDKDDVIITNLDTWGTWYGERKTVWFPLKPEQLISPEGEENPFDAIYLTSYLMDDENYYMGDEWRQIFYDPENPEEEFIAENYELKEVYEVSSSENYEKQDARAVLLVRKED